MVDTVDRSLIADAFGRPLRNLRLSVTDRCNLRCQYCMPEEEYVWLSREDLLTFEEIRELVASTRFDSLGANPCSAKTCQRWCRCWQTTPAFTTWQ
jgi:sulfatase maturation enzyme AslB (radical SAM superfamily)